MIQDRQTRQWAMFLHLSQLAGYIVPVAGLVVPIVIWQMKKEEMPELDVHGKVVANWIISLLIYGAVCLFLTFVLIGVFLFAVLGIIAIVFPIIGAIKANEGQVWKYPFSLTLL